ncbi:hypothetical protein AMTRI_Chr08g163040 [Amborella trichopoda]
MQASCRSFPSLFPMPLQLVDPVLLTDLAPGSLKKLVPAVDDLQTLSLVAVSLEPEHTATLAPGSFEESEPEMFKPFKSVADEVKNTFDADPFPAPTNNIHAAAEHTSALALGSLEVSEPEEFEPFESNADELHWMLILSLKLMSCRTLWMLILPLPQPAMLMLLLHLSWFLLRLLVPSLCLVNLRFWRYSLISIPLT